MLAAPLWTSLENSAGTKVIDVARTLGKSAVSVNKQRETTENPEPSTSSDSRVLLKLQDVSDSDIINNKDILMQKFSSLEKLANDEDDNLSSAPEETQNERPRRILVGWDSFRTKTMILLLILFLLWAAIYFPLIST
ncbi:uncharacterized protein LOC107274092 isoform X2 [Cephus cinctus]|uniref:Uncharacterized protein LOC107274092 isoform X2 n=1 Tax=Cephus cinctus TaxID=211228 RepID=A0AAJ7RVE4_CEPCN|nr:uncharacterized protein LOC107274092 isoform X2 [Cephus cinctus]